MIVRLAFAVAAHLEPEILIVDEVLAVGDASFQKKAIGKMKEVSQGGNRTVLFVSHDMEAVNRLCSRVIVLDKGQLVYDGETREGIDFYTRLLTSTVKSQNGLKNRKDRGGSGELFYSEIWLEDDNGYKVNSGNIGQPLKICLKLDSPNNAIHDVTSAIAVKDENGDPVTMLSGWTKDKVHHCSKGDIIEFMIPTITLPQGKYLFDLFLNQGTMGNVVLDQVDNAFQLEVLGKDYFHTGNYGRNFRYRFYLDFEQKIRSGA
jgi:lipopolysaccharide transport system ATP-binding protein